MVSFKTFGCIRIASLLNKERELMISANFLAAHYGHMPFGDSWMVFSQSNDVDTIYLLSQYDELLSTHLCSASAFSGLSNQIHNDLINAVGHVIFSYIKE